MIRKKKCSISLLSKELKKRKFHKSIDFEILIYYFEGSTKNIDFKHFIDVETLFNDKKLKRIRFEDAEKNQKKFKSKFSRAKIER